jgi:biopolymer transport protein ExbD
MHSLSPRSRRRRLRSRRSGSRFPGPEAPRSEMTPMVDVSFLLLIFFMLTIQFKTLEGLLSAHLPKEAGISCYAEEPPESLDLTIRVLTEGTRLDAVSGALWSGTGPYRFAPDRQVRWSLGPWSTTDATALAQRLIQVHRHEPDRRIAIDAHPGTIYSEAVSAFDAVQLAGWSEVVFVGTRD